MEMLKTDSIANILEQLNRRNFQVTLSVAALISSQSYGSSGSASSGSWKSLSQDAKTATVQANSLGEVPTWQASESV